MKTRIVIIIILLLILGVLLTRNDDRITNALLHIINPIKQNYKALTQEIEDKGHSYLFQKENIEKLSKENRILRKRLLEQTHYIKQVKDIYHILPRLSRYPLHNISLASTISYVKLNSFSQIILTRPKGLSEGHLYGLIQGSVAAGIAIVQNGQLYGYLASDNKCRFAVFVGEEKAPGIAIGKPNNTMIIKFIPKWHNIKQGDKVFTSGLDDIFFADIPVGVVTKVDVQSAYKVAYIKTYANLFHPKVFFLVNNAAATLTQDFDANATDIPLCMPAPTVSVLENNETNLSTVDANVTQENNISRPTISSIPQQIDQTQAEVIEPEIPQEHPHTDTPKPKHIKKAHPHRKPPAPQGLDLF